MKEHQQGGKVKCPKCGAAECFRSPGEFRCGSGNCVDADDFDQSDICKELCELRSNLTPEGAEPLVWYEDGGCSLTRGLGGSLIINTVSVHENPRGVWRLGGTDDTPPTSFTSRDAAKAHAEELHQAA